MKRLLILIGSLSLIATPAFLGCSNESEPERTPDSGVVDPGTTCTPITTEAAIAANCGEGLAECGALSVPDGCESTFTIDCGACTPEQAYQATKYVDNEIPHIPLSSLSSNHNSHCNATLDLGQEFSNLNSQFQ